jgi:hypothetical protein
MEVPARRAIRVVERPDNPRFGTNPETLPDMTRQRWALVVFLAVLAQGAAFAAKLIADAHSEPPAAAGHQSVPLRR